MRAATRGSALALHQTTLVSELIQAAHPGTEVEPLVVVTAGDRDRETDLRELGGKGVFVKEVQVAVLDGRADLAVHSAKDLPAATPEGLVIAAVPERADPRDALVGSTLASLAAGATVATGSARRRTQLASIRPDLTFVGLRGNIETRLAAAADVGAVVVAAAALDRLDLGHRADERLDPSVMLPQVGQGALAVECRVDDRDTIERLAVIDHRASRICVDAERAFLAELGGDCDLPAGAYATVVGDGVELVGLLASPAGHIVLRERQVGAEPDALGRGIARHLLDDAGGAALFAV